MLTMFYIIIVAVTTIILFIVVVHFADGEKLCSSLYEGDLVKEDGPSATKMAAHFTLTFVCVLLALALFVLYYFSAVIHSRSLTMHRYAHL